MYINKPDIRSVIHDKGAEKFVTEKDNKVFQLLRSHHGLLVTYIIINTVFKDRETRIKPLPILQISK